MQKIALQHFSDVPPGYWAEEPIEKLTALGIMNYYPDGTFRPERPVSRAEVVMLLVRAKNYPLPKTRIQVFSDVPLNFWAADYIQAAYENKLTLGYPDGTFKPRSAADRAEGITFLARFDDLKLKEYWEIEQQPFPDLPLEHWSIGAVLAAKEDDLLNFLKNKPFLPAKNLTRAELAETLYRTKFSKEELAKFEFTE